MDPALQSYVSGNMTSKQLYMAVCFLDWKEKKSLNHTLLLEAVRNLFYDRQRFHVQLLELLLPHLVSVSFIDVTRVLPALLHHNHDHGPDCALKFVRILRRAAWADRKNYPHASELFLFAIATLLYIENGSFLAVLNLKTYGSEDEYFEDVFATAQDSGTLDVIQDAFFKCVSSFSVTPSMFYEMYWDVTSRSCGVSRTLSIWNALGRPHVHFEATCRKDGTMHGKQHDCCLLYNLYAQERLFLFGNDDVYESFMRKSRPANQRAYAQIAVNFVLSMPACSTAVQIDTAMTSDALYSHGIVGLPLTGWAWELFADIASRYPSTMQTVLHGFSEPQRECCFRTPSMNALRAVLRKDMARLTSTYFPAKSLRWEFIEAIVTKSLERSTA